MRKLFCIVLVCLLFSLILFAQITEFQNIRWGTSLQSAKNILSYDDDLLFMFQEYNQLCYKDITTEGLNLLFMFNDYGQFWGGVMMITTSHQQYVYYQYKKILEEEYGASRIFNAPPVNGLNVLIWEFPSNKSSVSLTPTDDGVNVMFFKY